MPSEPLDKKLEAFNWHVIKINGHDYDAIKAALAEAKTVKGQPTMIIMHTVKGKGVSYMENAVGWHGKAPNDDEYAVAVNDINNHLKELGVEVNG
jgi:transketolase